MTYDDHMRTRLDNLFQALGARRDKTKNALDYVFAHYTDPARHYHDLSHISDCLTGLDFLWYFEMTRRHTSMEHATVELALWYHDLVYDPKLHNNEELSVAILRDHAREIDLSAVTVEAACRAIRATAHTHMKPENFLDECVVDIDLNILRTPEPRFDDYERKVREEYSFVDDASWIAGRTQVLQSFLDREWIYSTPTFRKFEGDARANIKRSLARLAKGEVLRMVR